MQGVADAFSLSGRLAVVTGAGRGIGRAVAVAFAAAGARLVLADVDGDGVHEARDELAEGGAEVVAVVADVTEAADRQRLVAATDDAGRVDVVVPAAGVQRRRTAEELSAADLEALWRVNVEGTIGVVQAFLPGMRRAGYGKVVTVGSLGTVRGLERRSAYAATKGAVGQFTVSLALEAGGDGVRANCVAPGYVDTAMTQDWLYGDEARTAQLLGRIPLGRFATPADLAGAFVFLASSASDYVTGQVLVVDGGWTTS